MKLLLLHQLNLIDVAAFGILMGAAYKIIPSIAALLAVVYYGFVIYDRIRYGPELEHRMFRPRKEKTDETSDT